MGSFTYSTNVQSPCLDCKDRCVGCHSKCEKFKTFRDAVDKKLSDKREFKKQHKSVIDYSRKHKR